MLNAVYNTKQKGAFVYIIFSEDDSYTAVCLNLNIVEYGTNPKELQQSIEEASFSYLQGVRKKSLSDEYLNQAPEKKYLEKLKEIEYTTELTKKAKERKVGSIPKFFELRNLPYHQGQSLMSV